MDPKSSLKLKALLMKILNFFIAMCFCSFATASDPMSSAAAHEATEKKIEGYDIEKVKHLPDETIITWELCPRYELGKEDIIQLVNDKELKVDGEWTSGTIKLVENQKHIALQWANDIDGEAVAKERSSNNEKEMGYFRSNEKMLLEKGKWNGHTFEYTYRWPGDLEKDKHIKVTVDITVKDSSSEIGGFLNSVLERIRNKHANKEKHKPAAPTHTPASSPVFAQQQPATIVQQQPQVIYQQSSPVVVPAPYYGGYYGPHIGIGIWGGRHHHRHW